MESGPTCTLVVALALQGPDGRYLLQERLPAEMGARLVRNYLTVMTLELQTLARQYDAQGEGIIVEPNRTDFSALLRRCRLSISQAGYNTVIETLQAGVRAVMVPFAGGSETEQRLRARVLAEHAWIDIVEEPDLTPHSLAQAINRASRRARLRPGAVALDGADASARLIAEWTDGGPP